MNYINTCLFWLLLFCFTLCLGCKSTQTVGKKTPHKTVYAHVSKQKTKPITTPKEVMILGKSVSPAELVLLKKHSFDNDSTIEKIQLILALSGYNPGKINAKLEQPTIEALRSFREYNQVPATDMGMITLYALGVHWFNFELNALQTALDKKGYDPGPIDNLMGGMTKSAYLNFATQHDFNIQKGFTETLKNALFSADPKYNNPHPSIDSLILATEKLINEQELNAATQNVSINNVSITNVLQALKAVGYDPVNISNTLTPSALDALTRYQIDNKLPIGDVNEETLKALGFK